MRPKIAMAGGQVTVVQPVDSRLAEGTHVRMDGSDGAARLLPYWTRPG
jgi:hypothetical protein